MNERITLAIEYPLPEPFERDGVWNSEPQKRVWIDGKTGLDCMIRRGGRGAWCGYVGVTKDHPSYGSDYYSVGADVHGGLTFADTCEDGDESSVVCHTPQNGRTDDIWWLGFDCNHYMDAAPIALFTGFPDIDADGTYRDVDYVTNEVLSLADQLAEITANVEVST